MSNSDSLKTDIKNFINVFNEHLEFMKLKLVRYDSLYKKIICVGIIDTLSKSVYPSENQNRKRFTKFLINYAQTGLWNKVSLGHLIRLLKYTNDPKFSKLEEFAKTTLRSSDSLNEPQADQIDPDIERLKELWPQNIKNIEGVKLDRLKHVNLIYNYRNNIIHELRRPGGLLDDDIDHKIPFYYGISSDDDKYFWKLVYPLGFFVDICRKALDNVKKYYIDNKINPYEIFGHGNYLIDILNKLSNHGMQATEKAVA